MLNDMIQTSKAIDEVRQIDYWMSPASYVCQYVASVKSITELFRLFHDK